MFAIFMFISVQVTLQHPGLDRSLSLKRNLQVKATFSSNTIASVLLCWLPAVDGTLHIKMFWKEHSETFGYHKVTYIVKEALFLNRFIEI